VRVVLFLLLVPSSGRVVGHHLPERDMASTSSDQYHLAKKIEEEYLTIFRPDNVFFKSATLMLDDRKILSEIIVCNGRMQAGSK